MTDEVPMAIENPCGHEPVAGALEASGEMLTLAELAVRLRLTVRTVENWQRRGVLPFVKVGDVMRFHWPSVVAHLLATYQEPKNDEARRTEAPQMARRNADGATTKRPK